MLGWRSCLLLALCLLGVACTPTTELPGAGSRQYPDRGRVAVTQGSAVAVTADQQIAVVTNRTDGIVTVMRLDASKDVELKHIVLDEPLAVLPFHPLNESKPWAAVIGSNDDTAYVLLRGSAEVVKIVHLHTNPEEADHIKVGSEPTSIVISPHGKRLFVANSGEGNVSMIPTDSLTSFFWPLNDRLAAAGFLGASAWDRPALAHPRALAITDLHDNDDDETLYATEFFSQPLADSTLTDPDRNRQGIVYPFDGAGRAPLDAQTNEPIPFISLAAVETGFDDSEGKPTGCFPNQLYGAAVQQNLLFVTSVCASPAGPVEAGPAGDPRANNNFKTLSHSVIFEIDTQSNREVGSGQVLTRRLEDAYLPEDPDRRMPLIPTEIVFAPWSEAGLGQAYVTAFGAGAVFPIHFDEMAVAEVGSGAVHYVGLGEATLPTGFALLSDQRALVLNDRKAQLGPVDLQAGTVATWKDTIPRGWSAPATIDGELVSDEAREGRRLFATGLGAWSFAGQGWSSCESCHPEGRSDGVTWRFTRGPRRTISLAGTYYRDRLERRMLLWTANIDEVHDVEAIARQVSGGVGGVVWNPYALAKPHKNCRLIYDGKETEGTNDETTCGKQRATDYRLNGLTGSLGAITVKRGEPVCSEAAATCNINATDDWDKIDAFVRTVKAPRAPSTLREDLVAQGEKLFRARGCPMCHGGPGWTLSRVFYEPGGASNGQVPRSDPDAASFAPDEAAASALLGELRSTTYAIPDAAPPGFRTTNPAAFNGPAAFRTAPAAPMSAEPTPEERSAAIFKQVFSKPPPGDQINCVLRAVGTFGSPSESDFSGITPPGATRVEEKRRVLEADGYHDRVATGLNGFNIPSLVGLAGGGPYFHAGNARTLEELFEPIFAGHHDALADVTSGSLVVPAVALTRTEVQALVSYLLSIDESDDSETIAVPRELFDPDLCGQFRAEASP